MTARFPSLTYVLGLALISAMAGSAKAAVYTITDINAFFTVPVYSESFDSPTNPNWTTAQSANGAAVADSTVNYGYEYTAGGNVGPFIAVPVIISAPSQGGTSTKGVLLSAQDLANAISPATDLPQGIAIFASNVPAAPITPYAIRFDLWVNYVVGSTSSSEFAFWGAGATGTQTSIATLSTGATGANAPPPGQPGATATGGVGPVTTGITFTTTGDGGFGRDLRTYNGTTEEITDTNYINKSFLNPAPTPPATTPAAGTLGIAAQDAGLPAYSAAFGTTGGANNVPGNRWLDVTMVYDGADLTSYINGQPIWSKSNSSFALGKTFVGYMDANSSVSPTSGYTFAIVDNYRIVTVPEPTTLLLGLVTFTGMFCRRSRHSR